MSVRRIIAASVVLFLAVTASAQTFNAGDKQYVFTLNPGGSYSLSLPLSQNPVRIDVSVSAANGATQLPSELMTALVNRDPWSNVLTWIGTSSNGATSAGTTLGGSTTIATIGGTNVTLIAVPGTPGTAHLKIVQNPTTTTIPGKYIVRMYY